MVVGGREPHVGLAVHGGGRGDVQNRKPVHAVRMVPRHAVRHPAAPVVPGDHEAVMAEAVHKPDHVIRHRALRVSGMVRAGCRHRAVTVASQIGSYDGEAFGQRGRDPVPHHIGLRITVKKQQRRAAPGSPERNLGTIDAPRPEAELFDVKHERSHCPVVPFRDVRR